MNKIVDFIGARILKTAIAMTLSTLIAYPFCGGNYVAFAPYAALIVLSDSVHNTINGSLNRIIGTIIGGAFTFILMLMGVNMYVIMFLGTIILFKIFIKLRITGAMSIATFVLISMVINYGAGSQSFIYAIYRILGTIIGIIVANAINVLLFPPNILKPLNNNIKEIADLIIYLKEKIVDTSADIDMDEFSIKFQKFIKNYYRLINEVKYSKISKHMQETYFDIKLKIEEAYHVYNAYYYIKKNNHTDSHIIEAMELEMENITNELEKIKYSITMCK